MSKTLDLIDNLIRRNRSLPRIEWLRKMFRKPYHQLLNRSKTGFLLKIGGVLPIRLPGEFCSKEQELYEAETASAIKNWSDKHSGGVFVDVGSSYGYFSCGVLFNDANARVIAIDADLPSLAITRHVCSLAPHVEMRLELFRTLIGAETSGDHSFASLFTQTQVLLSDPNLLLDPQKTNYVNLDSQISEQDLPRISLDDLVGDELKNLQAPCMIKCDVEGAELLVLQGASQILKQFKPTLLLSVHPPYLPRFGGSVEEIRTFLNQADYEIDIIAIDHEEHWLCLPN